MIENVISFIAAFWWVWPISGLCSGLIFASIVADKKKPTLLKVLFGGLAATFWGLFFLAIAIILLRIA